MGRKEMLTAGEIVKIQFLHAQNYSISKIAKEINRSRNVVSRLLKNPKHYGKTPLAGRPEVLSPQQKRAIFREASNSLLTAKEIGIKLGICTNIRNIQRAMKTSEYIQCNKFKRKPSLSKTNKDIRLGFAAKHQQWKEDWHRVVFTDQKKFNLDGPDVRECYFHDLRKEERFLSRQQKEQSSVMIWAGIGFNGKTEIKFVPTYMNSEEYINLIDRQLIHDAQQICESQIIFQHDNTAAIHSSSNVKEYFSINNIENMDWPSKSPDLKIIEQCWGMLARAVYADNKQFDSIEELKICIQSEWAKLDQEYIRNLFRSLPDRMASVIEACGGSTKY